MALGYGGNPYGPAGTGKTESVKALGQALGRQVGILMSSVGVHKLKQLVYLQELDDETCLSQSSPQMNRSSV